MIPIWLISVFHVVSIVSAGVVLLWLVAAAWHSWNERGNDAGP